MVALVAHRGIILVLRHFTAGVGEVTVTTETTVSLSSNDRAVKIALARSPMQPWALGVCVD